MEDEKRRERKKEKRGYEDSAYFVWSQQKRREDCGVRDMHR